MGRPYSDGEILAKAAFVLSLAGLSFVYGIATQAFGWFPSGQIERAWEQAELVVPFLQAQRPEWVRNRVYDREGTRLLDPEAYSDGVTLIATNFKEFDWKPGVKLLGREGEVLHEWRIRPEVVFADSANRRGRTLEQAIINGSHLFPNGDILVTVDYVGTARLDACGNVLWKMGRGNHHSIARGDDGSFWIPTVTRLGPATSPRYPEGFPGIEGPIFQDQIRNISGNGDILETFNVLNILYENDLEWHIKKASWNNDRDVLHLNDVEPLDASMADEYPLFQAGDLLVSLRFLDMVFVFDPDTKKVKWHASEPFLQQHDPDFMGEGWIGVFNNRTDGTPRGAMLGGSKIVAVQPHTDSTRVLFPTEKSEPFYTASIGQWQQLRNGNLLLTESGAGRVVEVESEGQTVWDWVARPYQDSRVPEVPDATRYEIPREEIAAWPCSPSDGSSDTERGLK